MIVEVVLSYCKTVYNIDRYNELSSLHQSHLFPFFSTMVGLFLFLKLIISLSFFSLFSIFIFKLLHNPIFLPLAVIYAQFSLIQNTKSKQNDIFKVIFPSASDCLLLPTAFTSVIQNSFYP